MTSLLREMQIKTANRIQGSQIREAERELAAAVPGRVWGGTHRHR